MTPPKYTLISQLPPLARKTVYTLYLIAWAILATAAWIAADRNYTNGVILCIIAQVGLCIHFIRRT